VTTRRVWRTPAAGKIRSLRIETEPLGEVPSGRIRVRTRAAGLNFADIFALTGLYSATPDGSFIPGLEVAGDVEAIGAGATGFAPGDRVMALTRFGGYADRVDIDPAYALPLPQAWSYPEGAAFPVQTLTAWYALQELGRAAPDRLTLVHSAAGGVGLQALRICRVLGVPVIGTVGREEKRRFLEREGFDEVIVRSRAFGLQLREQLGGRPLVLALDGIGGEIQRQSFEALAPTGRLVVYGAAEFTPGRNRPRHLAALRRYLARPRYDPLAMIAANRSVMAFNLIWLWQEGDTFRRMLREIDALGLPAPHVGATVAFADAPEAIEQLRSGSSVGKVVLAID
jgi:alcohol dehydrogenase